MTSNVNDGWGETPLGKLDKGMDVLIERAKIEAKRTMLLAPFDLGTAGNFDLIKERYTTFKGSTALKALTKKRDANDRAIQAASTNYYNQAFKFLIGIPHHHHQLAGIILKYEMVRGGFEFTQEDCSNTFNRFIDRLNTEGQMSFPNICRAYWQQPQSSKLIRVKGDMLDTGYAFCPLSGRKVASAHGVERQKVQEILLQTVDSETFERLKARVTKNKLLIDIPRLKSKYYTDIVALRAIKSQLNYKLTYLKGNEIKDSLRSALLSKLDSI